MTHRQSPDANHVLIVAPYGRDAESLGSLLRDDGYVVEIHADLSALSAALNDSTGVVIVTDEALLHGTDGLGEALRAQAPWSDVPFVRLRPARNPLRAHGRSALLPVEAVNVIELERPLGTASLLSAVSTAMRARQKQFEVRRHIDELAESRAALAASEEELRLVADALPVLIAFVDRDLVYRFVNQAYEQWFGIPVASILGRRIPDVLGPHEWEVRREAIGRALQGHPARIELRWPRTSGERRDTDIRYLPRFDSAGQVDGVHVFAADVTERKLALEASQLAAQTLEQKVAERTAELQAEMAARQDSEAALRQSQKMEAVGQLTGGIAHDFNNMLMGIVGALDVIRSRIEQGRMDGMEKFMDAASASAFRAAALTQRLLAFSRRQTLDAKPLEINQLVGSLRELLRRTLTEQIALDMVLMEGESTAVADSNQLESAVLNLAINARDAMPQGGTLTISSRAVSVRPRERGLHAGMKAGRYVVLDVSDTGMGMDDAVLEKVFEPFFTTKPIGQGTGLGLSMIYGFMQQSSGYVRVESVVGSGTTVSLFFPSSVAGAAVEPHVSAGPTVPGEGQTVLVVEDDPQVRLLVTDLLEELGYVVLAAEHADEALPILVSERPVDLLVSDVGLPGLNGRQLAEIARQSRPSLPVLFMTGYAHNATSKADFLEPGMDMIGKPFAMAAFSQAVSKMLT